MNDYFISFMVQLEAGPKYNSGVVSFDGPLTEFTIAGIRRSLAKTGGWATEQIVLINIIKLERDGPDTKIASTVD